MEDDDLETYYVETYPRVWRYVHRLSDDRAVAGDLAQEVFVRLLTSGRESLPVPERDAYVFTIATNLVRDRWKQLGRDRDSALRLENEGLHLDPRPIDGLDLNRALERLPERERSMIWLAYVEGLAHRDIARACGVREKSVKVLLFRIRRKLAALLGKET